MAATTDDFARQFSAKLESLAARFRDATGRDEEDEDMDEDAEEESAADDSPDVDVETEDPQEEDDDDDAYEDVDDDDEGGTVDQEKFTPILHDLCQLVSESAQPLDPSLVKQANDLEIQIVDHIEANLELQGYVMPYCPNLVVDKAQGLGAPWETWEALTKLSVGRGLAADDDKGAGVMGERLIPHKSLPKPSSHSSLLARFRQTPPFIPSTASADFRTLAEARCEITSVRSGNASGLAVSDIVVAGIGLRPFGEPYLAVQLIEGRPEEILDMEPGLEDVPLHILVDDAYQRIAVADNRRVKTFRWGPGPKKDDEDISLLPLNTLDSSGFGGPVGSIGKGERFVRAGPKHLAVWDMDKAPTHGATGKKIIGKSTRTEGYETDDEEHYIEPSSGSKSNKTVRLQKGIGEISKWGRSPSGVSTASFLCGFEQESRCLQLDCETGKLSGLWIGHGGLVSGFSTSPEDPHAFVTSCLDGVVRLYDVRQPAPVFACMSTEQPINAAALVYADGQPFIFVGGTKTETITCWDVRGKAPLYELSTGNSEVRGLGWDAKRKTLYAATVTPHIAPGSGKPIDYRRLRVRKSSDDDDLPTHWPRRAWNDERSFGVLFDAADNRIFRYRFKTDADTSVVPESGEA